MAVTVGIDLGTTNTIAGIVIENDNTTKVQIIKLDQWNEMMPSCLFDDGINQYVGNKAFNEGKLRPQYLITSSKRYMGTNHIFRVGNNQYTAKRVATQILKEVLNAARKVIDDDEFNAVIAVPTTYTKNPLDDTREAALDAGFKSVTIIREPIAALICYGLDNIKPNEKKIYFVSDFGGGTLDFSIIQVVNNNYEIICKGGIQDLGGDDFTEVLEKMIISKINCKECDYLDFSKDYYRDKILKNIYLSEDDFLKAKRKIKDEANRIKETLSYSNKAMANISSLYISKNGLPKNFQTTITREDFINQARLLFTRFEDALNNILEQLSKQNIHVSQIDEVVFSGGTMEIPKIKEIVRNRVKDSYNDTNLYKAIATGAAVYRGTLYEKEKNNYEKEYANKSDYNPIYVEDRLLKNIGVKLSDGNLKTILKAGDLIPTEVSKVFTNNRESQTQMVIEIYEGNARRASDSNNTLIIRKVINILPEQHRQSRVIVTVSVDIDGSIELTVRDINNPTGNFGNGKKWKIR